MELLRYWRFIKKRLWLIALIVIVSCTAVGYYTNHFLQPQYQATAQLIVSGQLTDPKADAANVDIGAINSNIALIKTYKAIVRTPRIMSKVAERFPDLHASADELIARVSVGSVSDTQVMTISATDTNYTRAAKMANAVSTVFQQEVKTLMKLDNVSILNPADTTKHPGPLSPHPTTNIMVAFIVSALIGIGIAFVLDQLDNTVKTEEDVAELLGVTALAAIPKAKRHNLADRRPKAQITNLAGGKENVSFDA
ncbi:lipopolysaccharide biosynthesis protein [Paenibacillus sp. MWE-103]|uniref:Lipopolysaccharide biosynthesis protein n=1 Tax=Paenibacillus artemisiicola TaxID=1172618 RepID=A0ABS3W9G4_9BACL|nr:Wzz/FepE/Etk N-terminal domain-containing protein [Paenibacillus artemisiicola]MBO7744912.1 lipopolysaccharide biosynthesis protein [Paenibacillus artemisiicola]